MEARIWLKIEINKKHKVTEGPKVSLWLISEELSIENISRSPKESTSSKTKIAKYRYQ